MSEYILETKDLGISFGGLKAAQNVNIRVRKNQIYGLIGPNGAGKTTIFNMLTGGHLLSGRRRAEGPVSGEDQPQGHCAYLPEHPSVQQYDGGAQCDGGSA